MLLSYIFGLTLSYLIGGIPFGYLIAIAKGIDIRQHGSGNIGASNVGRILGRKYGIIIFVLDLLKGFVSVFFIPICVSKIPFPTTSGDLLVILCGLCSILGHVFPLYLRFRGGKAVATSFGVFIWLAPMAVAISLGIWIAIVLVFRYVSLGSIIGSLAIVGSVIVLDNDPFGRGMYLTILSVVVAVLILMRHRANIQRIITGTEAKVFSKHSHKE
ncbi:MAG: glycerol-3-phosphate 1-O-acyltransferase [Candidatus Scalindua sp. AMX11]|nr:MAG: glycerol-3-phosphate 1-O-acyltransferase [Candidatus Scalindua sp.]NOG83440.1 glycerol-3-phosphate 1-O-acyltransferase PlsY [Planctomycetota bacterium]RZV75050.1 MAG: glycerol-3-phosphate 1-O-acyltransferase [Candidatus Scalindua sp. SCAELEC01]TDE64311.1 MAG: glycerol-3-phosphate 1-O-acyltransferase [Candidatus Scalindua sp. AMX11]GJQ60630.1 MAG: glycerol-3-phosphate 1-O-acyltransferase PlsY [Candidatus Scalindua sp.]